jgi:hypothetical protein
MSRKLKAKWTEKYMNSNWLILGSIHGSRRLRRELRCGTFLGSIMTQMIVTARTKRVKKRGFWIICSLSLDWWRIKEMGKDLRKIQLNLLEMGWNILSIWKRNWWNSNKRVQISKYGNLDGIWPSNISLDHK